jgi:CHAT domain-containing protein
MSLWSVDDEATRAWMRSLYEGRLLRKLDTADAVKQASLAVLKQRRAARQSTHPFYWGRVRRRWRLAMRSLHSQCGYD